MFLGEGAYGNVIRHNDCARKNFKKLHHIIQEQCALNFLSDCEHVVKVKHVDYKNKNLDMELYDMNLRKWINKHKCCKKCCFIILRDILLGLIELQDRNLSHSDIKPGNILIKIKPLTAVLGDCGFVSIAKYSKQQRTAPNYRDIVIKNDNKHDMYSFGLIFMELIYNIKPIIYTNYKNVINNINSYVTNNNHKKILFNLMNENREARPTARQVLKSLFDESNIINTYIIIKHNYNVYTLKYDIIKIVKENCLKYNIQRGVRGYQALIMYLYNNNIEYNNVNLHIAAMLIILGSTFSNKTPDISKILSHFNIKNYSDILTIITNLTTNNQFIKCMFS
jgi:serine/threonine protein kinase